MDDFKEQVLDEMRNIALQFGRQQMEHSTKIVSQAIELFDDLFTEDMAKLREGKIEPPHAAGILVGMALYTDARIKINDMESKH